MSDPRSVNLFISWSGPLAFEVAKALRGWLTDVFDNIRPWMSDVDIQAGQRGLNAIEAQLAGTSYGVVLVTHENQGSPWLNFEAGALSKAVREKDEPRVMVLLVDIESKSQVSGPLTQFQMNFLTEEGLTRVLNSVGEIIALAPEVIAQRMRVNWSLLEVEVNRALSMASIDAVEVERPPGEILDEILTHVRAIRSDNSSSKPAAPVASVGEPVVFQNVSRLIKIIASQHGIGIVGIDVVEIDEDRQQLNIWIPQDVPQAAVSEFAREVGREIPHWPVAISYSQSDTH